MVRGIHKHHFQAVLPLPFGKGEDGRGLVTTLDPLFKEEGEVAIPRTV